MRPILSYFYEGSDDGDDADDWHPMAVMRSANINLLTLRLKDAVAYDARTLQALA